MNTIDTSNSTNSSSVNSGQLAERVKKLMEIMRSLVEKGKDTSNVTMEDWAALGELVDVGSFERVGPFHDAMNWTAYTTMLTDWVNHSQGWYPVVKRIAEAPGVVFAQLEEMITSGDSTFPFYSLSMYVFNDAMKITRVEVYMQQEQPAGAQSV